MKRLLIELNLKMFLILALLTLGLTQMSKAESNGKEGIFSEVIISPFDYSKDVRSVNQYSGLVEIIIEGTGQGAGSEWNDAFWFFNSQGTYENVHAWCPLRLSFTERPIRSGEPITNFIVKIKDQIAIPGTKPDYNQTHYYRFTIDVGEEKHYLYIGNDDGGLWDNTGSFRIQVNPYLIIVEPFKSDDRCDIGTDQQIKFHLIWDKNGSNVNSGFIQISGVNYTSDSFGWVIIKANSSIIGEKKWIINDVKNGNSSYYITSQDNPSIIWDRVIISEIQNRKRVNVGSDPIMYLKAKYEYDGQVFQGKILLNDTTKQIIGKYHYSVQGIQDNKYGLTAYISEPIEVIYDRVKINLDIDNPRIQVGRESTIKVEGQYEYDNSPFTGSVTFDKHLTRSDTGKTIFKVASINDPQYGLTAFASNEVSCIFDTILPKIEIDTNIPSRAIIKVSLQYETDKSPVNDAEVSVNGVKTDPVSDGVYSATFISLNPLNEFKVSIKQDSFDTIELNYNIISMGNLVLEGTIAAALAVGIALNVHSRQRRAREVYEAKLSKLEEYIQSQGRIEFSNTSKILSLDETELRRLLDALVKEKRIKGYHLKDDKGFITEEKAVEEARRRLE
jgi:hypothetical protein